MKKSQIARALVLLCLAESQSHEEMEIHNLWKVLFSSSDSEKNFQIFQELATLNAIEPMILKSIDRLALPIPLELREELLKVQSTVAEQNLTRLVSAQKLFDEIAREKIPVVILKGQALAKTLYQNLGYKKMNDIDFLVRREDLDRLYEIYRLLGYQCLASLDSRHPRSQEKYSHHWPAFVSADLKCVLGTHWNLVSPLSGIQIDEKSLWQGTLPMNYLGHASYRLGNEDFLMHLLLHLAHYKTGLKELLDIMNFLRWREGRVSWNLVTETLKKNGGLTKAFYSLSLAQALSPLPTVQSTLNQWRTQVPKGMLSEIEQKTRDIYFVVRSRSTHVSRIEKNYALFSLSESFLEKFYFLARMWKDFLWIPPRELIKMKALEDSPSLFSLIWGTLQAPYLISRVFVFDMGWKLHLLLIGRHHVDLARSFLPWLRGRAKSLRQILADKGFQEQQFLQLKSLLE